ncbi:type IV secretion system protein VirB7 [Methylorubrum rhodinum]|uniref:Type IV secretion system protein VirB7 n=2 Tax=Methylorubrum TaxID=2282523 RepID=A0A840ZNB4_9HYPH|nr:hypothetical protein [Methylorubrum rhodinum]MBB5758558.1 type IV secretion system protein VirB7 [Methylorubrum rhodinum]
MHRIMMASLVAAATGLGGCASVMGPAPAPSCDGGARRPLNRSMWDWEGTRPGAPVANLTAPASGQEPASPPAVPGKPIMRKGDADTRERVGVARGRVLPNLDIAASLLPCAGDVGHG